MGALIRRWAALLAALVCLPGPLAAHVTTAPSSGSRNVADIRALRASNNAAIARHDMAGFLPMFADDAAFVWSNGTSAMGKAALTAFFARDFADPAFDRYVRTPDRIRISDRGVRAAEHGHWIALKKDTRYGDYLAHWAKGPDGWRVRGELYVKLFCKGPLCTP